MRTGKAPCQRSDHEIQTGGQKEGGIDAEVGNQGEPGCRGAHCGSPGIGGINAAGFSSNAGNVFDVEADQDRQSGAHQRCRHDQNEQSDEHSRHRQNEEGIVGRGIQGAEQGIRNYQQQRQKQVEYANGGFQLRVRADQRNGPPVDPTAGQQASQRKPRHKNRENRADGEHRVADHDKEKARPNDFVDEAATAGNKEEAKKEFRPVSQRLGF